jgi:hypothetical protein
LGQITSLWDTWHSGRAGRGGLGQNQRTQTCKNGFRDRWMP